MPGWCRRYAGVLSAVGIHLADIVQEAQEPAAAELSSSELPGLAARLDGLAAAAADRLRAQGFKDASISTEKYLNLR
jgi:5-oxoprolinase (ATP-hydrolysing)